MLGPLSELTSRLDWLRNEMEPAFWGENGSSAWYPPMNIWEDADRAYVEAEIPGVKIEDVEVSFHNGELTLKGEKKFEAKENTPFHRRERVYGTFARSVELPWQIDAGRVTADLKDGVLTITLPKAEASKPRKVEVKYLDKK